MASGSISAIVKYSQIKNNLTTTAAGGVLDARQGKALYDKFYRATSTINTSVMTASRTELANSLIRIDKVVYINLGITFSASSGVTSGNFAAVPTGFKPGGSRRISIIYANAAGQMGLYFCNIGTDGMIYQGATGTLKTVLVIGSYALD